MGNKAIKDEIGTKVHEGGAKRIKEHTLSLK